MMIKVKPKYHKTFIPALITFISLLVIGLLILAAFTHDTAFWIVIIVVDLIIIFIGFRSIRAYRKPKIISSPLGKVLQYEGRVESVGEEELHPLDKKNEQEDLEDEKEES